MFIKKPNKLQLKSLQEKAKEVSKFGTYATEMKYVELLGLITFYFAAFIKLNKKKRIDKIILCASKTLIRAGIFICSDSFDRSEVRIPVLDFFPIKLTSEGGHVIVCSRNYTLFSIDRDGMVAYKDVFQCVAESKRKRGRNDDKM